MLAYSIHFTKTAEVILVIEEPEPQWGAERERMLSGNTGKVEQKRTALKTALNPHMAAN